eukprot:GHVU01199255.1.p1 GENE.GHVU01199255.1~~GHVU01199255.1.p1  ORF type:complete len:101 (-),score=20.49 GHVU01199255.1:165-467(-)
MYIDAGSTGGSSGSAMAGALKIAKTMKKGQRVVVLFPDSIRNYMTKFADDSWMVANGLMSPSAVVPEACPFVGSRVGQIKLRRPVTVTTTTPIASFLAAE